MLQELTSINNNLPTDYQEEKDLFIATLVHDFKNAFNAQLCSLNLFNKGTFGEVNSKQKEVLEVILESLNSMKTLSYSILNTYKYQNGAIALNKERTDVNNLIKSCIAESKSMAEERNIFINYKCELKHNEKMINIDCQQIRRVISNLINNGINYAFRNTEYEICLKRVDNKIVFEFVTQSPIIDDDVKSNIFKKYTAGVKQFKSTGFGLGLYLSRKIVEAHNGEIYLDANGTTNRFVFELTLSDNINAKEEQKILWK